MAAWKEIQAVSESQVIVWSEAGIRVTESTSIRPPRSGNEVEGLGEDTLVIRIHKSYAHPGGVYVYRITWRGQSVVYATDTEGYVGTDRRLVNFARHTDVLIHDAQYLEAHYRGQLSGFPATQGYGHSTATMACEVAFASEVGQLILFHHEPSYSDAMVAGMEATAKAQFSEVRAASEGLEIGLPDRDKIAKRLHSPLPRLQSHRKSTQWK